MKQFMFWLVITLTSLVAGYAAESEMGVFSSLALSGGSNVGYYTCMSILGVWVFGVVEALLTAFKMSSVRNVARYGTVCTGLGLLGTFLGLVMIFGNADLGNIDTSDREALKQMMAGISTGLSVAFNTTIVGLIAALNLSVYEITFGRGEKNG